MHLSASPGSGETAGRGIMFAIGIDLGTAFVRAAVVGEGATELLQFGDGARNLPAAVAVAPGGMRVGRAAMARATTDPTRTVRACKRLLGRTIDDPVIKAIAPRVAFGMEAGSDGLIRLKLGTESFEVEQIASALIRHVLQVVEQTKGGKPASVVLTIPYWYGPRQRQALAESAKRAGLTGAQILSEATCTALSLLDADQAGRLIAIVDAGAGGCTASILELGARRVRLVSSSGDAMGGGEDVDYALARAVFKGLKSRFGEFDANASIVEMLRQTCESAKQSLSQMAMVTAVIPFLPIGSGVLNQQVQVDRETATLLIRDSALRVGVACRSALETGGVTKGELAAVYATGGSTRMEAVRAAIEEALGPIASRRLDPDGSVALGAATQAAMLAGLVDSVPVLDIQASVSLPPAAATAAVSLPPARINTMPPQASSAGVEKVNVDTFRLELAGLLASLRAGALTDSGMRKKRRVVARTNEIAAESIELEPGVIEKNAAQLQSIWTQLAMVMQTARQYGWEHPQSVRALQATLQTIEAVHAQAPQSVLWDIGTMRFSYHDETVWKPDRAPYDRIPYELFAEGVRAIQLQPGLTEQELRELLGVLLRDAALGFGSDDDAATALWDRKFTHVAWLAVDAFAEGDDPIFHEHRDEIARQIAEMAGLTEEGEELLDVFVAARRNAAEQETLLAVDEITRAELVARIDPEYPAWLDRYATGFARSYRQGCISGPGNDVMELLGTWTERQVTAHAPGEALQLLCALDQAAAQLAGSLAGGFRDEVASTMFPPERMGLLFDELSSEVGAGEASLARTRRALALLPGDSAVAPLIACYAKLPGPLQTIATEHLALHATGNEASVGSLLADCPAEHALVLIRALRELNTHPALAAVSIALRSPHVEVRMQGLAALPETSSERLREEIQNLIGDVDPSMRIRVLKAIEAQRVLIAGPALTRRIQADSFAELPIDERRFLLRAVGSLNRSRADGLAIGWLEKQQVFKTDAVEQTRAICAEFLAGSNSAEAVDALQRAAKKRLFQSQAVRDTAARALESVMTRRASLPPTGMGKGS